MGSRTRFRRLAYARTGRINGYISMTTYAGTVLGGSGVSSSERNEDVTMAPPYITPHPLLIWKTEVDPLIVNGEVNNGYYRAVYMDYNPTNRSVDAHCPVMSNPIPWSQLKTKAMALMNPSKPSVDLPVFLFELKDLPRMIKQLGDVLSRKAKASDYAGGYVAYSFGWAPLISDLGKLINLSKMIDDRARYLQRLADRKGTRKRLGKHGPFTTSQPDYVLAPYLVPGTPVRAGRKIVEEGEYWATGKVNLMGKLPTGFDDKRWLAARAALGLNLSAASLWEATPWSWLIDYFSNVGDILDAQRGFIPIQYKEICVMARVEVRDELSGIVPQSGLQAEGGTLKRVYKQRAVYIAPSPSIHFDSFLTNHQMGILGSLATARALRGIGR